MELYSLLLLIALLAFAVGLVTQLFPHRAGGISGGAVVISLVAALASLLVHLATGHRPGSEDGLGAVGFVAAHPALCGVLVASAVLGSWQRSKRGRG